METQTHKESNVVSLSQVRSQMDQVKQEESISKYLGILSFSQLINETSNTINKLNDHGINKQTAIKSKLVIEELGNRIDDQSSDHSTMLSNMKKHIDKKIKDIQDFL